MRTLLTGAYRDRYGRDPSLGEAQALQAVSLRESRYGEAWEDQGAGSYNLGGIQAGRPPCDPARSFEYTDRRPTSSGASVEYRACFRRYPSLTAGAADLVNVLFVRHGREKVRQAAARGDLGGVARQMHATRYYEGQGATVEERIANYAGWIGSGVRTIARSLGEPEALRLRPKATIGSGAGVVVAVAIVGVALAILGGTIR
jgi:hypothetical protein